MIKVVLKANLFNNASLSVSRYTSKIWATMKKKKGKLVMAQSCGKIHVGNIECDHRIAKVLVLLDCEHIARFRQKVDP